MAFSINNNITSMQAQQYLRETETFQTKTISRVTSGLRIVASGDDAAGLAIANSFRSDIAVLRQGIRNANDGLSALQTIDGGLNNISQLLDRARTLAAQSASGTFIGNRAVLNSEFQSVVGEIDRQAQAIGLDSGGFFARNLSVFIGGGRENNGVTAINNGSVSVDLSQSTVDAKSLGLKGTQSRGLNTVDIGTGSVATSVAEIVGNATNQGSVATSGFTDFYFRGPGFGDSGRIKVSVNLSAATDTSTLVEAINTSIESAANGTTPQATAFKNAGIRASVVTNADGTKQIAFNSSNSVFQVEAGDRMANALLGNVTSSLDPTGLTLDNTVTGGAATAAAATTFGATGAGTVTVRFQGGGLTSPVDISLAVTATTTIDAALASLTSAVAQNAALQAAGIAATTAAAGSALVFANSRGERFDVLSSGDLNNLLGLGSYRSGTGAGGSFDYTTVTGASGTFAAAAETLEFSLGGGPKVAVSVTPGAANIGAATDALNASFSANATLSAAGLVATNDGTDITITSSNGTAFRINTVGATNVFGFNNAGATGVAASANAQSALTTKSTFETVGAYQTDVVTYLPIRNGGDAQTITVSANDSAGALQSLAVVLRNDATGRNARTIDEAINSINTALRQSNNATLQKIVAVKEQSGGAEGIRFMSTVPSFKVSIGTNSSGDGVGSQGTVVTGVVSGGGSTADISTQDGAAAAVNVLAGAVLALGDAQAVVGRGQNQFSFAVNLASSQVTNLAASESRIRDADLAAEAANLSKAQISLQAGVAALSQANSAPQSILSLLQR